MKSITNFIRLCFLALFFLTPLIFTSFNSELFELPKMYFVYTITIIISSFHLFNYLRGQVPIIKRTILDIPLLLFLASQTISTFISVDPHTSIFGYYSRLNGGLLSVICYILLYFILIVYLDDKFKNRLINLFLFSGILVAGFGIAEHFGIDKNMWVQDVQSRVFSTLGQPNWLAAYLCILLPFTIFKFLSSSTFLYKSYFLLLTLGFYACLLFTKSKSGIIAAIISLGIFFLFVILNKVKDLGAKSTATKNASLPARNACSIAAAGGDSSTPSQNDTKKIFTSVSLVIALLVIFSLIIPNPIKDQLFPSKTPPVAISNSTPVFNITPSEDIRKIVWKGTFELWKKFPIFGTGTETFAYTYYWTRPVEHNLTSEWDFLYNKAHNEYLNYLATTGTVGFVAYLLVILAVILNLIQNLYKSKNNYLLLITTLSAYISILITNIAGFSVVIVSIFLFLLPALTIDPKPQKSNTSLKPNIFSKYRIFNQAIFFLVIVFGIFTVQKTIFYYLADIYYAQSQSVDSKEDYETAYNLIKDSLNLRQNEPIYFSQASLLSSKMAIVSASKKDDLKTQTYIDSAIQYSNQAIQISPANTNLWKERAQMYYYLSSIDTKYFQESINSLTKVTLLAPTDAKTFYLIGQFLDSAKLEKDAATYYQKAIALKPNYDHAYFALGIIELEQKDYSNASNNFQSAVNINPKNTQAQTYIDQIKAIKK